MNQILDIIQLYKTGSVLSGAITPLTSSIFTSGSVPDLYFKNTLGTIYKLNDTGSYINIIEYTSSGEYVMGANVKYLQILCIGGGGGGGSGRANTTLGSRSGGAGGGGGGVVTALIPSGSFTLVPCMVTIGPGGAGGPSVLPNLVGIGGANGTASSIAISGSNPINYIIYADGGDGGGGGGTSAVNSTSVSGFTWQGRGRPYAWPSSIGRATNTVSALTPPEAFSYLYSTPGGGQGGSLSAANVSGEAFSCSAARVYGVLTPTGSPSPALSAGTGSSGVAMFPPAVMLNNSGSFLTSQLIYALGNGLGSAGHGGGAGNATTPIIVGGRGGDGVTYGAGGGGGGACASGSSGNGGRGGPGYILIIEYI